MDIDVMKIKSPSGGLPQTDNFAVLLVQGLESNDPEILNVRIHWYERVWHDKSDEI